MLNCWGKVYSKSSPSRKTFIAPREYLGLWILGILLTICVQVFTLSEDGVDIVSFVHSKHKETKVLMVQGEKDRWSDPLENV